MNNDTKFILKLIAFLIFLAIGIGTPQTKSGLKRLKYNTTN